MDISTYYYYTGTTLINPLKRDCAGASSLAGSHSAKASTPPRGIGLFHRKTTVPLDRFQSAAFI